MCASRPAAIVAITLLLLVGQSVRQACGAAKGLRGLQQSATPGSISTSLDEARQLQQAADEHIKAAQFKEAVEKTEQALAIRRQLLGEMHPDVAYSFGRLGFIAYRQSQPEAAEAHYRTALRIREATLGPDHLDVAESLNDLATMLLLAGDYVRPEPLFKRTIAIYEKALAGRPTSANGRDAPALIGAVLSNLALLYQKRGDHAHAESQYLKALAIKERTLGSQDPSVGKANCDLGAVYYASAQYDKARQFLQRALPILPDNHSSLATCNFNLAAVYFDQGDYQRAEGLFRRALAIDEEAFNARRVSPATLAIRLVGLAEVLRLQGRYADADPLYQRALTIREHALGSAHPDVARTLIAWSLLRYATGDVAGAVDLLSRGARLREDTLTHVLTTGSEEEKRLYLRTLVDDTDIAISLHLRSAPTSTTAASLALTNVLQRKGRSIDAMTDHMATLRGRANDTDRKLLQQFSDARSLLARTVLTGVATEAQRQRVTAQRGEVERLEQTISTRSGEFRVASRTATLEEIQETLPAGTALIEFASYRPFFVGKARDTAFGAPRYAAYVLRSEGIAASIDLGEAAPIDRHAERFRAALSNPYNQTVRAAAGALHQALVAPAQGALRDLERIIISPDGALNLIPFAALVGKDGKYLVEHFTISYMTSGRDLTRLRESGPSHFRTAAPPVVLANPSFNRLRGASEVLPKQLTATRGFPARFSALPGTAQEAAKIAEVLPNALVFTGANATEAVLKQVSAPSILHIATHGFFLRRSVTPRPAAPSPRGSIVSPQVGAALDREDALGRSGLALAGADHRWSGNGEDGILTALEVAGLDLWGTRMVVLSACETGVGDARVGEGVYGLRRALVLAGSESQVMSLWRVDDAATRDLMIGFYQRLRSGEGRAEALRNVQLTLLRGPRNRAHPFYWASFIQSGDWRKLFD